jgi:fumarylacetoacetase
LGVWISGENALGEPVSLAEAPSRIAGLCLLNDWSARDLQAWEYQPLGPFLAKNFLTTLSPWMVTMEALAPFRTARNARPEGDPKPLPYLWSDHDQSRGALSIDLDVLISTQQMRQSGVQPERLSQSHSQHMYWTIAQMVAHHTVSGCNLMPGDLLGTGTLSGPTRGSEGSLTEISLGGQRPLALANGQLRSFLEDGDELIMRAHAVAKGWRTIGFGDCRGQIVPATTRLSTEGA